MWAPRRTPYERPGALDHLYSLLYPGDQCDIINDDGYRQSRNQGLSIVHLWLNRCACPHAVESTGSLIHAQELDEQLVVQPLLLSNSQGSGSRSGSEWAVRCAYSTAILRFVNSVVDTFQTAMFAKSIFQISQRIGLPAYLVELRHAATHEELPSLVVLRDACREVRSKGRVGMRLLLYLTLLAFDSLYCGCRGASGCRR
jgi:ribosomal biogenesis protein LAS1